MGKTAPFCWEIKRRPLLCIFIPLFHFSSATPTRCPGKHTKHSGLRSNGQTLSSEPNYKRHDNSQTHATRQNVSRIIIWLRCLSYSCYQLWYKLDRSFSVPALHKVRPNYLRKNFAGLPLAKSPDLNLPETFVMNWTSECEPDHIIQHHSPLDVSDPNPCGCDLTIYLQSSC